MNACGTLPHTRVLNIGLSRCFPLPLSCLVRGHWTHALAAAVAVLSFALMSRALQGKGWSVEMDMFAFSLGFMAREAHRAEQKMAQSHMSCARHAKR